MILPPASASTRSARNPGCNSPAFARHPQHCGGHGAGHADGCCQIDSHHRRRIAHRRRHVETGAREGAVGGGAAATLGDDPLPAQHEFPPVPADRRHRVGDQRQPVGAFRRECDPQACRVHVMPVGDHAAPALPAVERRADCARLAAAELAHRVEQMGEAAHAFGQPGLYLGIACRRMPGGNHHAALGQRANRARRGKFRRESDQRAPALQRGEQADRRRIQHSEPGGVVDAGPGGVEERPLDVDAKHARHPRRDGGIDCRDRARDRIEAIADQRGQKAGGAETPVGLTDCRYARDCRIVVEQGAAAAVDLEIDEAGEQVARQLAPGSVWRALARRCHGGDAPAFDRHAAVKLETGRGQQPRGQKRDLCHRVSVTLRKCGGRSGSKPRARLSAAAKR